MKFLLRMYHEQGCPSDGWVFPANTKSGHTEEDALKESKVVAFPPYGLRHSALTDLAVLGCDAFTLARIAEHSSISITQRYCHPQADAIERAFGLAASPKVVTKMVTPKNRALEEESEDNINTA